MEDNNKGVEVTVAPNEPTRKCKCCGEILPISSFRKNGRGYMSTCRKCEQVGTDRFQQFTSRELIDELRARGYRGELHKVTVTKVKI